MTSHLRKSIVAGVICNIALLVHVTDTAWGNNGSLAIASSVSGIEVDGELSDWPEEVPRIPIALNLWGSPTSSPEDFQASYRVGFNKKQLQLYLAIEVLDDSLQHETVDGELVTWKTHDGCDISLNVNHGRKGATAGYFGIHGDELSIGGVNGKLATSAESLDAGGIRRYEFSFDLRELGIDSLEEPRTFVWSIMMLDKDEDGSFSAWFWSPGINKVIGEDLLGDLIVGAKNFGKVTGKFVDGSIRKQLGPVLVDFESLTAPEFSFRLLTEAGGKYDIELPVGKYRRTISSHKCVEPATITVWQGKVAQDEMDLCQRLISSEPLAASRTGTIESRLNPKRNQDEANVDSLYYELTSNDDLFGFCIYALARDHIGSLWIATSNGLARQYGSRVTRYGEPFTTNIRDVWFERERKNTWIASEELVGYIDSDQIFHRFNMIRRGLCVGLDHRENVFIGTKQGLYSWDEQQLRYYGMDDGLPSQSISSIAPDPARGVTWIGTDQGLASFDGTEFRVFGPADGLDDPRVFSLCVDRTGTLLIGTSSSLYQYKDDFELIEKHPTERERYVRDFSVGSDGTVYAATFDGIATIKDHKKVGVTWGKEFFNAVVCDEDNQLWAGLELGPLRRIDMAITSVRFVPGATYGPLAKRGDTLWFSETLGDSYLCRLPPDGKLERVKAPDSVERIYACSNGVWLFHKAENPGDSHAVYRFREGKFEEYQAPFEVHDFCYDSQGVLWIVSNRGLAKFQNNEIVLLREESLPNESLNQIDQMSDGRLAIAAAHGIYLFSVDGEQSRVESLLTGDDLDSHLITGMHVDQKDRIWIGKINGGGLLSLDHGSIRSYRRSDGLLSNDINQFLVGGDVAGTYEIWSGNAFGINRVDAEIGNVQTINTTHSLGLIHEATMIGNNVWLATESGIWRYRKNNSQVSVVLDNVTSDHKHGPVSKLETTTDCSSITFDFHAVSLKTEPDGVRYQYRFRDLDENWRATAHENIVLDVTRPLNTTLELRAIDRDLAVSDTIEVDLTVTRPYLRWATLGGLLLACTTTGLLVVLHVGRTYRAKEQLEDRVAERTLELKDEIRRREAEEQKGLAVQEELHHNRKMQSLGTLATGVAHDFNNALFAIGANAEVALLADDLEQKNKHLSTLLAVSRQAADLTKSMLVLGGKSPIERKPIDLTVVARESLKILERTLPALIEIEPDLSEDPVWCMGDSSQLQQVIINLSINARDAMPDGGELQVKVAKTSADRCAITIADTGFGMSESTKAQAFEPFFSSKPRTKGTGLGLSIVHGIVTDHGGTIHVDSQEGLGSTFIVELPTIDEPGVADSDVESTQGLLDGVVLVVDDNKSARTIVATILENAGLTIEQAEDGEQLVEAVVAAPASYDLLIVDVDMPKLDGISALRQARETRSDLSAIIISGLPDESINDSQTLFLRKPFSRETLLAAVEQILAAKHVV